MSEHAPEKQQHRSNNSVGERIGLAIGVIGLGVAAVFVGQLAGASAGPLLLALFSGLDGMAATFVQYLFTQALVVALLVGVAYLFKARAAELGLGKVKDWTYLLLLPLIYIGTLMFSVLVSVIVGLLFTGYDATQAQNLGLPPVDGRSDLLITGLFLVVAVPLAEEFIFRGYLYGLLRRYVSFWTVTVIVSIIFAIAHGQLNVAINVFFLSLALCYIREKTGSIWTGVALHALKNFIAFLLLFVYNVV